MGGWKTWAAAALLAVAAGLEALGRSEWAQILLTLGGALGLVGLGHKLERAASGDKPPKP